MEEQQQGGMPPRVAATLLAQLVPGGSCSGTSRLAVELSGSGATGPGAVAVPVAFGPPVPDAAELGSALEVAASRAPAPAGLPHLLSARLACAPDGRGGLVLHGTAATPASILDFKPLLAKRVAPGPLAQRLQDALLHSPPPGAGLPPLDVEVRGCSGAVGYVLLRLASICNAARRTSSHMRCASHSAEHSHTAYLAYPSRTASSPWIVAAAWCCFLPVTLQPTALR